MRKVKPTRKNKRKPSNSRNESETVVAKKCVPIEGACEKKLDDKESKPIVPALKRKNNKFLNGGDYKTFKIKK